MERIILVHLTDVHIGSSAYNNPIWTRLARAVANGHSNTLVDELMTLWDKNQAQLRALLGAMNQPLNVVVTGDLTRVGSVGDFTLSWDFFSSTWSPPRYTPPPGTSPAGLNLGVNHGGLDAVPGNHDQWAGANWWTGPPAYNPAGFRNRIGATHWEQPRTIFSHPTGSCKVELYGVDSNSGLQGHMFRATQLGIIDPKQLAQLEQELRRLGPIGNDALRVALCHHGFDHVGSRLAPLDDVSRDALLLIAADHDISAVLTGHSHYIDWQPWQTMTTDGAAAKVIWELRSTTPTSSAPTSTSNAAGPLPAQRTICHGFLVHDIRWTDEYSPPSWHMYAILLYGGSFQPYGPVTIPL